MQDKVKKNAVVLLSGGLDSATCLAIAKSQGFDCYCLSLDYHQRHIAELHAAKNVANVMGATAHKTANLDFCMIDSIFLKDDCSYGCTFKLDG